ncbi:MAG: DUF2169 domain-containing protein [Deltaproteobacteria bacterium]|nr:DUF2169 domain-containing protein [Deltaproteobacteria bacterium]
MMERNGANILRIVLKGAFTIGQYGKCAIANKQPDIVFADEYWGEPGHSAVKYESDVSLRRPYTDLIVNGYAYAPDNRPVTKMDVSLHYQSKLLKSLTVFGDRFWDESISLGKTSPEPFVKMPITYDRAFGGSDDKGSEPRNRSGAGYNSSIVRDFVNRQLPNIEDPFNLITTRRSRPQPMGLGIVAKNWEPRLSYAGTYDDAWQANEFPLLPKDFDLRFNQCTSQDQWIKRPVGGEIVDIFGMTMSGILRVSIPPCDIGLSLVYSDKKEDKNMELDSILFEPSEERVILTWSATADIHGDPFRLKEMIVGTPENEETIKTCRNC